ncbi:MAG: hypothetical protein IJ343_04940 [Clostridia bacterium]|nr:hypothetical protein [Clostridia bacterium]
MFDLTVDDVLAVYEQLKVRYAVTLTNTLALDDGFTIDCPIVAGQAHGQEIWLYEYDGLFVMDVMDAGRAMGTHWHPNDVEAAVRDIVEFMDGKSDYPLQPFARA